MIPKVIHYCWFGGNPLDELSLRCIESWKKYCPDYEIIEWNESNFDVNYNTYTRQAYEKKKYAFVSDVARLKIVYDHGGFYFDTDVELVKPIDTLRQYDGFLSTQIRGVELPKIKAEINTGIGFGAVKHNYIVGELLKMYDTLEFITQSGTMSLVPCTDRESEYLFKYGYEMTNKHQHLYNMHFLPIEYFGADGPLGCLITSNTYGLHRHHGSWKTEKNSLKMSIKKVLGPKIVKKISNMRKTYKKHIVMWHNGSNSIY